MRTRPNGDDPTITPPCTTEGDITITTIHRIEDVITRRGGIITMKDIMVTTEGITIMIMREEDIMTGVYILHKINSPHQSQN